METPTPKRLTFGRIALYSMASAGLNILAITIDTWLVYFYAPPPELGPPAIPANSPDRDPVDGRQYLGRRH